jgi:hypothetical protein
MCPAGMFDDVRLGCTTVVSWLQGADARVKRSSDVYETGFATTAATAARTLRRKTPEPQGSANRPITVLVMNSLCQMEESQGMSLYAFLFFGIVELFTPCE